MKTEILFYYESRQNPNGDPGFENQPRKMPDETILVTDVRLKRTMRDYAKGRDMDLFADFADDGLPTTADGRASEIAKNNKEKSKDYIEIMLKHTFDVPLFGALVTLRSKEEKGNSLKLTGPMQFAMGRSVNKVNVINPTITSRFIGDEKKGRHTTIGSFYAVEYALIKTFASINPANLVKYAEDNIILDNFTKCKDMIPDCLWHGTNNLVSRSKYPQKSILYIEVNYKDNLYNDLAELVDEIPEMKESPTKLAEQPFVFTKLVDTLNARSKNIESVKIRCIEPLDDTVDKLVKSLPKATKI